MKRTASSANIRQESGYSMAAAERVAKIAKEVTTEEIAVMPS